MRRNQRIKISITLTLILSYSRLSMSLAFQNCDETATGAKINLTPMACKYIQLDMASKLYTRHLYMQLSLVHDFEENRVHQQAFKSIHVILRASSSRKLFLVDCRFDLSASMVQAND
jgi:hypothetical protein